MKPLSGFWLYVNLVAAVVWDLFGLILFGVNFIPIIQIIALVGSVVLDFAAVTTSIIFVSLYYLQLGGYIVALKSYQAKTIASMLRLSHNRSQSQPKGNKLSQLAARKVQQIAKKIIKQMSDYLQSVAFRRLIWSLIALLIEAIPVLGDFLPTWTIKAWLQLSAHRKRAKKLKEENQAFEQAIAHWRQSLSLPRSRSVVSSNKLNNVSKPTTMQDLRNYRWEELN